VFGIYFTVYYCLAFLKCLYIKAFEPDSSQTSTVCYCLLLSFTVYPPPLWVKSGEAIEAQGGDRSQGQVVVAPIAGSGNWNSRRIQVPSKAGYCPSGGVAPWP
jgi:hypothetical protein